MERKKTCQEMLEKLLCPAFLVNDGVIYCANQAANARQANIGEPIKTLISTGQEEYESFTNGRLCLSLTINDIVYHASVVKFEQMDLFYLESDYEDAELRAFALASQCLRDPLSEALTVLETIKQITPGDNPELEAKLQNINRNLHQFNRALCNMSDVAQYDQSRTSRSENRNIVGILDEIINKLMSIEYPTGHTLTYHGIKQPIFGIVDSEKLERAIFNLISNAVKYSPKNSALNVTLRQTNDKLYFSVENELPNYASSSNDLFSRYLREPGLDTQNAGIGLGLTMVRKAAVAHGGTLLFDQPDSHHIRFTMSIAIRPNTGDRVHSPVMFPIDYAGGFDHLLVELSDILPAELFE